MRDRIFGHVRSNLIGYLALFVALSGGAYAAAKIDAGDIERNAVRSKHIKKQQVKSPDVKDNALTGADVNEESLEPQARAAFAEVETPVPLVGGSDSIVLQAEVNVPVSSTLLANASLFLSGNGGDDDQPRCDVFDTGPTGGSDPVSEVYRQTIPDTEGNEATMPLSGAIAAEPGLHTVDVRCDVTTGGAATASGGNLLVWTVPG